MQQSDGRLLLSPTDVAGFLACPHLTQMDVAVSRGELARPVFSDPYAELIRRKGSEHEAAYLAALEAAGRTVLRIPRQGDEGYRPDEAQRLTEEAIRAGTVDVIYQPLLAEGDWRGFADFLERSPDGTYEPVDTKLARSAKPDHVLQLSFYAGQLGRVQGRVPEHVHVVLGTGERQTFRTAEYAAYFRRAQSRLSEALEGQPATYPWPCEHCSICDWRRECQARLVEDDNLVLVAGLGRSQADRLGEAGIGTLAALGTATPATKVAGLTSEVFEGLRHQAELQLHHRQTGRHRVDDLPLEDGRGYHILPQPSPGDVWLDLEGHPFFEPARGLEYLFGFCFRDESGTVHYEALWAKDRDEERAAFERFVDWVVERRSRHPGLHVYHYAEYERSALTRLMGEHGTRETEIDDLLRGQVLVDLYRVTRQALRASVESYSIKKVEALYGFERQADVSGGNESTVVFEQWLACGDPALLEAIARYNEDDCRSTVGLHEWLLSRRPAGLPWRPEPEKRELAEAAVIALAERERIKAALVERSTHEGDSWWLLSQLLDYHRREAKPQWWEWFRHLELGDDELVEDTSTLGALELAGDPVADKLSLVYRLSFPDQDHKIRDKAVDPATQKAYKVVVDDEHGVVKLWRGVKRADEPLPRALIPTQPLDDPEQREAVLRFARSHLAGDGRYACTASVLERATPHVDLTLPPPQAALTLDRSHLLVQGPPGSGKTWQGAKAAIALLRAGRRIGVAALSHKAINKLLAEIEREATEQGVTFRGRKKHTYEDQAHVGRCIDSSDKPADLLDPGLMLVAGTAWLFARHDFDQHLDTLFIDEAGQFALADLIACGLAARNLVLLGDPNQLPQVSQGAHPDAAKVSGLQHVLGEHKTVPADRGIFLAETWRLRPELCAFTSEAYYEGRLSPAEPCRRRTLAAGNGPAVLPILHEGRSQSSWEEAGAIAAEVRRLLGTPFTDANGTTRPLGPPDILVVAPYNAQVRALIAKVPAGVRVGTVDKFQGQEAPIVFVSFASSSGADAPRGIQFVFDRHRVNVATSRAQCRAVLVYAPRLLDAECRSTEQLRLVNTVCRFVEMAGA